MDIGEPTVASTGLGSKPYPSNLRRMFNKYLTRLEQSLSRVRQNPARERKTLRAECNASGSWRRRNIFKQIAWNFRIIFCCLSLRDSNNIKPSIEVRLINEPGNHQDCALNFLQYYEGKRRLSLLHMRWVLPTYTMRTFWNIFFIRLCVGVIENNNIYKDSYGR